MKFLIAPRTTRLLSGLPPDRPKPIPVILEAATGVVLTAPIWPAKDWIVRVISAPSIVKRCPVRGSMVVQRTVAVPTALGLIVRGLIVRGLIVRGLIARASIVLAKGPNPTLVPPTAVRSLLAPDKSGDLGIHDKSAWRVLPATQN
jgi:hypothetical protein